MRNFAGLFLAAFILSSLPAAAASVAQPAPPSSAWRLTDPCIADTNRCALRLSLHTDSPIPQSRHDGWPAALSTNAAGHWTSDSALQWNADLVRTVDHFVMPPDKIMLHVQQANGDFHGDFEGANDPNATFAGFQVVIH